VLVLEVGTDISFHMLFKGLGPMEEACPLLVLHGNCGVITAVNHPNNIPICLSTVRHESLELELRNTVPCHRVNAWLGISLLAAADSLESISNIQRFNGRPRVRSLVAAKKMAGPTCKPLHQGRSRLY
jgi:hypothetical protein